MPNITTIATMIPYNKTGSSSTSSAVVQETSLEVSPASSAIKLLTPSSTSGYKNLHVNDTASSV